MSAAGHALRRIVLGEAGPAPAWVLAAVAMVIAFIVVAGPLIRSIVHAEGLTAIATTHDRGVMDIADRVLIIDNGQL